MTIEKNQNGTALLIAVEGRLDTRTAPDLKSELEASMDGISDLTFDLSRLEYLSSAGLHVLLYAQKRMNTQGKMTVTGCSEEVLEIFQITGFSSILTIK